MKKKICGLIDVRYLLLIFFQNYKNDRRSYGSRRLQGSLLTKNGILENRFPRGAGTGVHASRGVRNLSFASFLLLALLLNNNLCATDIDGTHGTSHFRSESVDFSDLVDGNSAVGFVALMDGFSVPEDTAVTLNVLMPVQGDINLHATGQITLDGDLWLGSRATISDGGVIDGQGHCIFLQGPLTIPAGTVLSFASDTIIDGQDHELIFEEGEESGGQFVIDGDSGITVTLRNVILKGVGTWADETKAISFGDTENQRLVLDNTTVILSGDYTFEGGALDIQNTVIMKGDYTFNFFAPYDCTLATDATLVWDLGFTFNYKPSDRARNHIVMEDSSSHLFLNGCTMTVPTTRGVTFTNGHILVDGRVVLTGGTKDGKRYGFMFGDGTVENDVILDIMPAASLEAADGYLTYKNVDAV